MKKKFLKLFIALIVFYVSTYILLSRRGMSESIQVKNSVRVWGYNPVRQQVDKFVKGGEFRTSESIFRFLFSPCIKVDRLFGNYHVLEENIPGLD